MRLNLLSLLFTCLCSLVFAQNQTTDKRLTDIDSIFNKVLRDYRLAGFSVAVVQGDSLIYSKGFGYRDYEKRLPATPNTLYAIGSSSKAFTAALVAKLFGDSLSLDDKIGKHLPQLHFQDGREAQVTVRDLMTHRTGITRYDFSWYIFNSMRRDSLLQRVAFMKPTADLRTKWQYNNFMYLAQGMIAERMTGKTWEENVNQHFFIPLGMKRSNFSINEMAVDTNASLGYTVTENDSIKKIPYYNLKGMGPAGSINSSVLELANWLKLWINGGTYGKDTLLSKSYIRDAASSQMVIGSGLPGAEHPDIHMSNYGLGWMLSSYKGHYRVEHGGNIDGFSASVCFFPSDKLGIVVLTNQNGSAAPDVIRNSLADRFLNLSKDNWNTKSVKQDSTLKDTPKKEKDMARVQGTKPSHSLGDYTGMYQNDAYGRFHISIDKDTLKTHLTQDSLWLSHYHYDVFDFKQIKNGLADTSDGQFKINFQTGLEGRIVSATLDLNDPSGEPVVFKREANPVTIGDEQLQAYVGTYEVAGMRVKITVDKGIIFMDVPGQTNYETIPQGDHLFKLKILNGFSVRFETDPKTGKVSALYAIQPNGTFKATRIND
ncbi:serine hydrolase [Olivibacter sp. XZL3]|uniref:serine hydrolase n=1 Tax=Olivibacter sp. XZL3 TaxID=1735116 RepID=UPI0010652CA7|nr:serine hydrolase [Olivibacter sp. XZL3]